jgi:hypothetical protein
MSRRCCDAGQHVKEGLYATSREKRDTSEWLSPKACPADIADIIAKTPTGDLTSLVTKPCKSVGNWFRDRCDEASLLRRSARGLHKAGATIAAENGATSRQTRGARSDGQTTVSLTAAAAAWS